MAEVRLWGSTVGAIAMTKDEEVAAFEYDASFAGSGIEIAGIFGSGLHGRIENNLIQGNGLRPAATQTGRPVA